VKLFKEQILLPIWFLLSSLFLSFIGLLNAFYLTIEHLANSPVACPVFTPHCNDVLTSSFAEIWGVPLALLGVLYYLFVLGLVAFLYWKPYGWALCGLFVSTLFGFLFSLILVYIQIWVLHAICFYCMLSAGISIILFGLDIVLWRKIRNNSLKVL
jgi:uncharacterized membrane protein